MPSASPPSVSPYAQSMHRRALQYDTNGDGSIDALELANVLKTIGKYESESQVEAIIKRMDTSGDGKVQLRELVGFLNLPAKKVRPEEEQASGIALSTPRHPPAPKSAVCTPRAHHVPASCKPRAHRVHTRAYCTCTARALHMHCTRTAHAHAQVAHSKFVCVKTSYFIYISNMSADATEAGITRPLLDLAAPPPVIILADRDTLGSWGAGERVAG